MYYHMFEEVTEFIYKDYYTRMVQKYFQLQRLLI